MRSIALASLILGSSPLLLSQAAGPATVFDVADVHASPRGTREGSLYLHAGRLEMHGVTMLKLIEDAYGVSEDRIFGGPNWLDANRFEIIAKTESPLTTTNFQPLLRALLEDRFQLKINKEERPEPILALTATKHVLLKELATPGNPQCQRTNEDGYMLMNCQSVTMGYLAERLGSAAPNYFNHPVVDKTGLKGSYDIKLRWSGRGQIGGGDADHPSISLLTYFEKELGIKVEQQARPADSLAIQSVNEVPTPNLPGTVEKLPPPVTEFEVAEVRPSKPNTESTFEMKNGRIQAMGVTLKELIGFAYNLDDYMLPGDKWLDTDQFDIIAKAEPSTTNGTLQAMLQALMAKRFHLQTHFSEQQVPVWALTAPKGKGKMKETAGNEHAGCVRTPKDGAFIYTCHNTTMAQFASRLPDVAGAAQYLNEHPMVDLTELKGAYDFEISWSPPNRVYGNAGGGIPTPGAATAVAPSGGVSIFDAIDKQLGLKLAVEKHSMPVIVIDHLDRTPSEN